MFCLNTDDNPDVIKVFSKIQTPLTLEFIKGCLLGVSKTIMLKCVKQFGDDFPRVESNFFYFIMKFFRR